MGDTHITGRHIGGGTHITSDMCAGIHISRGDISPRHPFSPVLKPRQGGGMFSIAGLG